MSVNSNFTFKHFHSLDSMSKSAIYQEANESHNVQLVRQLNDFGMKPQVPTFSGPAIVSNFMDIATKFDTIFDFLKKLRQTNKLLTEQEFQSVSKGKWIKKSCLSRILGSDHLIQKIMENQSTRMKVPKKIAVVKDSESLEVKGWEYSHFYDFNSDQVEIYVKKIKYVDRKLSRLEIDELINTIATANFCDLNFENIMVAEDGVYFIDTEFKSFVGSVGWEKMKRFQSLISEEDKDYFNEKVNEKMNEPRTIIENNNYDYLENLLELLNEAPEILNSTIEKIQNTISKLDYVGAKKAGNNWSTPNKFTFNLKNILNTENEINETGASSSISV